ncbi:MAG: hypothetical protein ACK559_04720, partial [bacterium]
ARELQPPGLAPWRNWGHGCPMPNSPGPAECLTIARSSRQQRRRQEGAPDGCRIARIFNEV